MFSVQPPAETDGFLEYPAFTGELQTGGGPHRAVEGGGGVVTEMDLDISALYDITRTESWIQRKSEE